MYKTSCNVLLAVTHAKQIALTSCKINNANVLLITSSFHTRKTMDPGSLRNPSRLGMLSRFICVQSICLWWKIKISLAKRRATRSMIFWIIVVEGFLSWCSNVCWMRYVDIKDCCTNLSRINKSFLPDVQRQEGPFTCWNYYYYYSVIYRKKVEYIKICYNMLKRSVVSWGDDRQKG